MRFLVGTPQRHLRVVATGTGPPDGGRPSVQPVVDDFRELRLERAIGAGIRLRRLRLPRRSTLGPSADSASRATSARPAPRPRRRRRRPVPRPAVPGTGHPGPRVVVQEVQGELGAEHRAAEVHQHDDAVRAVGRARSPSAIADGVGAERRLVQPGRDLDPHRPAVQHLAGQRHRGVGQRPAVGDDDQPDRCRPRQSRPAMLGGGLEQQRRPTWRPGPGGPTLRSPR